MNKNIVIGIIVIILLGGGYWAWQQSSTQQPSGDIVSTGNNNTDDSQMTSFQNLIAAGTPVTCSYAVEADGHTQNGTVYVADGKMRADFASAEGDASFNGSVIRDSEYSYSWGTTAQGTFGIKTKIATVDATVNNQNSNNVDVNKPMDMHCKTWTPDTSKFTPPSDVQFQDMSAQMDAMQKVKANDGSTMNPKCVACDQVTDPTAKAQCQQALGCS